MLFSFAEIFDIVVMALAIGFVFKDSFPRRPKVEVLMPGYDPLKRHGKFKWDDFWFAVAVVGPSIILHEFGHKFMAMSFGLVADFHADYFWLVVAIILKLISFGLIFFVPAYVSVYSPDPSITILPIQSAAISFIGPGINLALWLGAAYIIKHRHFKRKLRGDVFHALFLVSKINMFLFIFNMLPIPGFDGWNFFGALFRAIF